MDATYEALVVVDGYSPEGMDKGKNPEVVWRDRLTKAFELLEKLENRDMSICFAVSGGGDYKGKSEAEMIKGYAEQNFEQKLGDQKILIENESEDTQENVSKLHNLALSLKVNIVFTVSSKDHVPRVVRDWTKVQKTEPDYLFAAVPSDKTYSLSGKEPFILEAAVYEPFVDVLNDELMAVDSEKYSEAADELRKVLQKFQ